GNFRSSRRRRRGWRRWRLAMVAAVDEEEWNSSQEQQGPLRETPARYGDFAAVANGSFDVALIDDFQARLRFSINSDAGEQSICSGGSRRLASRAVGNSGYPGRGRLLHGG